MSDRELCIFEMPKWKFKFMRERVGGLLNHITLFILMTLAGATCWSRLELIWSFLEGEAPRPTSLEELP